MPKADDIRWFKQQFQDKIKTAVQGTAFTVDMLTAIACQETGYIWQTLRKRNLNAARILELCVGDIIDSKPNGKGRKAFPKNKALLLAEANGPEMFAIARQAFEDMAQYIPGYQPYVSNKNKFCRGFGVFQYDLQHFLTDPQYFLQKRYADFDASLEKCLVELRGALKDLGFQNRPSLTDLELAYVAIVYNAGFKNFRAKNGLKQGHEDGGVYYGQAFFDFLKLSRQTPVDGLAVTILPVPEAGTASLPLPEPIESTGRLYKVVVHDNPLRLRSEPRIDKKNPTANVIARLPDGHIVQAVTNKKVNDFLEVETSLSGAHLRGFAFTDFLKPAPGVDAVPVLVPQAEPPASGITAVIMPRKAGTVTRRTGPPSAQSLNESGQPGRKGTSPAELRDELAAIGDWLAVDKKAHKRYQPQPKSTFCNVYAHDYCHLAGVYLPRVWWTPGAIERLAQGQTVPPRLDDTIEEIRANGLFRWLRDFGMRFGWRQTGSLSSLQLEVNQGAVGIIVARRKVDGLSGHIVAVVPEMNDHRARRNNAGDVIAPLQSQAGRGNFRYGTGQLNWWKGIQFADSAFWLHS
jgi:hypothetical protein